MPRRLPSEPPSLPGFTFVQALGSGGFADVFLYEQNLPHRLVAVKVLLSDVVTDELRRSFQIEANLQARLSAHPAILTVHQAGVAADGRPYLVMEHCSAALAQRYRARPLAVPDVLSIAVRIASAVETAHRDGVLHRDIKPSNILTTAYGHPVLSDFGIAATIGDAAANESVGLSIPWSAPEVLHDEVSGSVASEVWSLGATVYSLLAGRSPFEIVGGDNGSAAIMARIRRGDPPPTGRADVPESLERVLRTAMRRSPAERQPDALAFIRELQAVELELDLAPTPVDLAVDEWATAPGIDLDDPTALAGTPLADRPASGRRQLRRPGTAPETAKRTPGPRRGAGRGAVVVWSLALVVALAGGFVAGGALAGSHDAGARLPVVSDVGAEVVGGGVVFDWRDPGVEENDAYIVTVDGRRGAPQRATEFQIAAEPGERVCATVSVTRDGRTGSPSAERCVEVPQESS